MYHQILRSTKSFNNIRNYHCLVDIARPLSYKNSSKSYSHLEAQAIPESYLRNKNYEHNLNIKLSPILVNNKLIKSDLIKSDLIKSDLIKSDLIKSDLIKSDLIKSESYFSGVFNKIEEDIIFKTQNNFRNDESTKKVNLGIGIYANAEGVLPPIKDSYLPLSGDNNFLNMSEKFVFDDVFNENMFKFQTCGGTGALSLAEQIIKFNRNQEVTYGIPLPTWPNHQQVFKGKNILNDIITLDFFLSKYCKDITPPNVIVIQTSCHNPTGIEYTLQEKTKILDYAEKNNVTIIFDTAYLGLSGDFNNETNFLKMGLKRNIDMFVCLSYSKIGDVYGHRTGALFFRPKKDLDTENVKANIEQLIRINISNTPRHGSDILMEKYLGSEEYVKLFKQKIKEMADRINVFRQKFGQDLEDNGIPNNIKKGKGMFSLLRFSPEEITSLQNKYHIYLLPNGRINICGITNKNYDYILECIVKNHRDINNI
jgi:aspartate aminotransferase